MTLWIKSTKTVNVATIYVLTIAYIIFTSRTIVLLMHLGKGSRLSDMAMKMGILNCQTWTLKKMMKHLCQGDHPGLG